MKVLKNLSTHRSMQHDVEQRLMLKLLIEIEGNKPLSQRTFASKLNVAIGLVNAYLKRCIRKGLVKIDEIPTRRYAYYLTPQGFSEKSRMVADYLGSSLHFFREVRNAYTELLQVVVGHHGPIVMAGNGDLTEIALLSARELGVAIACVYDPGSNVDNIIGVPVHGHLTDTADTLYVLSDQRAPQEAFDRLSAQVDEKRILAPALLSIRRAHSTETVPCA